MRPLITTDRLRELLSYDPNTGKFTWLIKPNRKIRIGSVAGTIGGYGYNIICLDYQMYRACRLAWFYVNGEWPANEIDHIDGDRMNDSIANLRNVTSAINKQNKKRAQKNNSSGFLGVEKSKNRWVARIKVGVKKTYLGSFKTPTEAHAAYLKAKRELHEGCTI